MAHNLNLAEIRGRVSTLVVVYIDTLESNMQDSHPVIRAWAGDRVMF